MPQKQVGYGFFKDIKKGLKKTKGLSTGLKVIGAVNPAFAGPAFATSALLRQQGYGKRQRGRPRKHKIMLILK